MFNKIISRCMLPIILGVLIIGQLVPNKICDVFKNEVLTSTKFAQKAGYIAETYEVVTQDGYILQMDRVAGSKKSPPSDNKTAVLLLHGILDASFTWLVAGPEKALGFILADEGYDVWMGNVRGNRYSRKHLNLTTLDPDYWMFSWHEMGIYDMPAMIDHIIEQTKQEKIFVITHSQGGTVFFVMASERPEYQEKIIAAFAFAPAVFISRKDSTLLQILSDQANNNYFITCLIGIYELKPVDTPIQMIAKEICRDESPLQILCVNSISLLGGIDVELNRTLLPLILQYVPAGASVKQFAHFGQLSQSGKFRKFDYGLVGNIEKYGKIHPPDYNLSNVVIPVYLHYGANDVIVDVQNVQKLYEILPNAQKFLVSSRTFAHLDFIWGKNINTLLYNEILSLMERYRK